jgi:hypothetical protein
MQSACFEPGVANPLPPELAAITGDKEVVSPNPLMRRARPQVSQRTVNDRSAKLQAPMQTRRVPHTCLIGVTNPQPCQRPAA